MACKEQYPNNHRESVINYMLSTIPPEWNDFLVEGKLMDELKKALEQVYGKHIQNQIWQGVPRIGDIFNWMPCPPKNITSIVLLMEPKPCDPEGPYRSTGIAFGVERREGHERDAQISYVSTLWKLFEILHKCRDSESWTELAQKSMRQRYNAGFNPHKLSERGILFLNAAITKGKKGTTDKFGKEDKDLKIWWPFIKALLDVLANAKGSGKITVMQFYNNSDIQKYLEEGEDKYLTYLPDFMKITTGHVWHLSHFKDDDIKVFVESIIQKEEHRRIIEVIAKEVIDGSGCSYNK